MRASKAFEQLNDKYYLLRQDCFRLRMQNKALRAACEIGHYYTGVLLRLDNNVIFEVTKSVIREKRATIQAALKEGEK